jgi:hypothetical protein
VGLAIELTEFTPEQVQDLVARHSSSLTTTQQMQLMDLLGGHPYLIRLALYHLACQDLTLEQLLQEAPTPIGIYEDHLRRHWKTLSDSISLSTAFSSIISATEPMRISLIPLYQLYSMGLIQRQGDGAIPRCSLYQQYFREQLKPVTSSSSLAAGF